MLEIFKKKKKIETCKQKLDREHDEYMNKPLTADEKRDIEIIKKVMALKGWKSNGMGGYFLNTKKYKCMYYWHLRGYSYVGVFSVNNIIFDVSSRLKKILESDVKQWEKSIEQQEIQIRINKKEKLLKQLQNEKADNRK